MRQRAGGKCASAAGFTLIELLVALAVLGFTAALLLAGLTSASRAALHGDTRNGRIASVAAAQRILRDRIERILPVVKPGGAFNENDLRGTNEEFSFYAPSPDPTGLRPVDRYRIRLTANGVLALYSVTDASTAAFLDDFSAKGWREQRLLDNVTAIDIAYFGEVSGGPPGGRWLSFWQSRPQAPDAVRIRVQFARGDQREWSDLIIRPRATANTVCRLDEVTGRCEVDPG